MLDFDALLARVQDQPRIDEQGLRLMVEAHAASMKALQEDHPFMDAARAAQVADRCLLLLAEWSRLDGPQRILVELACRYFVEDDDEEHDLDSLVGFDDDAEVVNIVARRLGHESYCIDLD